MGTQVSIASSVQLGFFIVILNCVCGCGSTGDSSGGVLVEQQKLEFKYLGSILVQLIKPNVEIMSDAEVCNYFAKELLEYPSNAFPSARLRVLRDVWDNPISVRLHEDSIELTSFGPDGILNGSSESGDDISVFVDR